MANETCQHHISNVEEPGLECKYTKGKIMESGYYSESQSFKKNENNTHDDNDDKEVQQQEGAYYKKKSTSPSNAQVHFLQLFKLGETNVPVFFSIE